MKIEIFRIFGVFEKRWNEIKCHRLRKDRELSKFLSLLGIHKSSE
jgi:hypothetical protein